MKITHAALLCVATSATPCISWASTPNNGTLTPETKGLAIQYTVGPFTTSNPTPVPQVDDGPRCNAVAACDSFKLTITIPANSAFTTAKVRIDWPPSSASDYDLYVFQGEKGDLDGATPADAGSSASSDNPETATIGLTPGTTAVYTIKVVPFAVQPMEVVTGTISLQTGSSGGGGGNGGDTPSCAVPAGVRP